MSTQPRTVLLVGDRFAGFAVHEGVRTVSDFISELLLGGYADLPERTVVRAAQGVTLAEWAAVREEAARLGLDGRLEFQFAVPDLSPQGEVHKRLTENTLIADLRQEGSARFLATLRVHNDNELLLDHQTGQHVQGMVAVEAARQMFLAVSERFYASSHPERSYYYVIDTMNTSFENFLFPLDATVEFTTTRAELADPSRLSFSAEISVHQAGRRASLTHVEYTAFESALIEPKEHKRAQYAVDHVVHAETRTLVNA
ncbi:AfsA-related hotdog domain-containing protein [Kitasatospora sp. NPDC052896]|uniref:AfsA-related hotdog domain-containing protein n=1 Tax=Kitasatospora sp. NPDC052896 TaxID=3364061 RepID=UPI0037C70EA0